MDLGVISVRYARALLKCATGLKLEDQVYKEMQTLSRSFLEVPELRFTIDNPMLPKDKKAKLIATACGDGVCDLTKKFVDLVLRDDRKRHCNSWRPLISPYIESRRTLSEVPSSLPLPSQKRPRTECGRWWRTRLMDL